MKVIENSQLLDMFEGGYKMLNANKAMVDSLNVFPVPDGDTGTNMSLTMSSAIKEIKSVGCDDRADLFNAYARGALKGARGNSGVILSQIIKGISKTLADYDEINTKAFACAFENSRETAYNAVTKPKEGTILTVIRYIAENAQSIASKHTSFITFFEQIIKKGEEILSKTPDMLPVLKQAGVVDAGGRGLLCVFQGYLAILKGEEIPDIIENNDFDEPTFDNFDTDVHDLDNIKFAYCTEYFITNIKKHVTEEYVEKLREKLMEIGDCVIAIGDISFIKVHVHTNEPNKALGYALQMGELDKVKIENMLEQNRELRRAREANKKPFGTIAVCAGEGIARIFKDLTVDYIIEGGQTMNPSVDDMLQAVERINSDNIIILPNNKNIIMAADKVSELTKKKVYVIPTTDIAQGIHAAIALDPEFDAQTNVEAMSESYGGLRCGEVTKAVRETELDGFKIKVGDYIGLDGKQIVAKSSTVEQTALDLVKSLVNKDSEVITLYFGEDVKQEDADKLIEKLEEEYEDCDILCYDGGQPHYYYLLSIE